MHTIHVHVQHALYIASLPTIVSSSTTHVQQSNRLGIEHNIPHRYTYTRIHITSMYMFVHLLCRFLLKLAPLHKSYNCSFCKSTIKSMQKFVKCSRKSLESDLDSMCICNCPSRLWASLSSKV